MKRNSIWLWLSCCLAFAACSDILEEDISESQVMLVAPGDSALIHQNRVTFLWEPVSGASGYLLQVVSPSFASPEIVVVDTFVTANTFSYDFAPGAYAWRLSAENSAYYSPYYYGSFVVDTAAGVPDTRQVRLIAPTNTFVTGESALTFSWNTLEGATGYLLRISGATDSTLYSADTTLSVTFNTPDDTLFWQVSALTEGTGNYHTSVKRWFFIDQLPTSPTLSAPDENSTFTQDQPITFSWGGMAPPDFKEYVFTLLHGEGEQQVRVDSVFQTETSLIRYGTGMPLPVGNYLWEVQTVDKLGNRSLLGTATRNFVIQ